MRMPQRVAIQKMILANFMVLPRVPELLHFSQRTHPGSTTAFRTKRKSKSPLLAKDARNGAPGSRLLILRCLFATDGQAVDAKCRSGYGAAEFEVAGDFGNVEEHFFQIAGDGDFFDGV